ncbi:MAG: DNA-binding transcriptional LysR family regulator [Gammaproteobacteria bacterium]|jgi:DNA-binding transcriptional LysR family regulator
MEIDLLRTFLEVRRLGSFRSAAENLHVTQAAVSQRVKHLESILDTPLFIREKNNSYLTAAGEQLVASAESIVKSWSDTVREIAPSSHPTADFSIAAKAGVWDICGASCLSRIKDAWPALNLNVDLIGEEGISRNLVRQTLDLAFVFNPSSLDALNCVAVFDFDLALYRARTTEVEPACDGAFVYVEWGRDLTQLHEQFNFRRPTVHAGDHLIARDYLGVNSGTALLPVQRNSALKLVAKSPRIKRQVFALWHKFGQQQALVAEMVETLGAFRDVN